MRPIWHLTGTKGLSATQCSLVGLDHNNIMLEFDHLFPFLLHIHLADIAILLCFQIL